ncbi:uncharacterized protein B0H18DRAFT_416595 [Fomitopsis serialis]|uniref:uncharacterized protein n=1 Tax=Fomitopsis serialis TaxID=139415 RepID=UPI002008EB28|nr:uncharacterized protein B0H18DRAFT_416595 [Neoantrodia serialis]KAH9935558.1 hypothetical protein B0H18DRAFT_416595 [Neoantrodia serialis]
MGRGLKAKGMSFLVVSSAHHASSLPVLVLCSRKKPHSLTLYTALPIEHSTSDHLPTPVSTCPPSGSPTGRLYVLLASTCLCPFGPSLRFRASTSSPANTYTRLLYCSPKCLPIRARPQTARSSGPRSHVHVVSVAHQKRQQRVRVHARSLPLHVVRCTMVIDSSLS